MYVCLGIELSCSDAGAAGSCFCVETDGIVSDCVCVGFDNQMASKHIPILQKVTIRFMCGMDMIFFYNYSWKEV